MTEGVMSFNFELTQSHRYKIMNDFALCTQPTTGYMDYLN